MFLPSIFSKINILTFYKCPPTLKYICCSCECMFVLKMRVIYHKWKSWIQVCMFGVCVYDPYSLLTSLSLITEDKVIQGDRPGTVYTPPLVFTHRKHTWYKCSNPPGTTSQTPFMDTQSLYLDPPVSMISIMSLYHTYIIFRWITWPCIWKISEFHI